MAGRHELGYYVLRYVSDAVKDEFVNIGVVLVGEGEDASFAEVRFTRDWRRVLCMDPGADLEMLQALERDIRSRLKDAGSRSDVLYRLQDLCSNLVQISPAKGCLGEEPAQELESLAKLYLEGHVAAGGARLAGGRRQIVTAMRSAFEREGVWELMRKEIAAEHYTYKGDPLKIDCGYRPNGTVKMFHAVSIRAGVDGCKALAFSFPQIAEGMALEEKAEISLTAVVENGLDRSEEAVAFALATLQRSRIAVAAVAEMPRFAELARQELRA